MAVPPRHELNRRWPAAVGSAIFFVLAPGVVAGLIPWALGGWMFAPIWYPVRVIGLVLTAAGAVGLVSAFAQFVVEGLGTPAPVAEPRHLVIGGQYRYVRNPMYVSVVAAITGQALLFGQPGLLVYAAIAWAAMFVFVRLYEEPHLAERFGAEYEEYRRNVPGWWPRPRPWRP